MNLLKSLFHWLGACILGLLIINALCFIYERPAYFIKTEDGASPVIRHPGVLNVHGTEGYSIGKVDHNGYLNPEKELADDFVLIMGASHTLGKELSENKRFSVLISDALSQGDNMLHTYNIAHDGNFLPGIFRHFQNAVQSYPNSSAIIIEIGSTDFTPQEITENLKDIPPCTFQTAQERFSNISRSKKIKCMVKEAFPFYELLQIKSRTQKIADSEPKDFTYSESEYLQAIRSGLSVIRENYTGSVAFVYHPQAQIQPDGKVHWIYSQTWTLFQKACHEYDIDIIDLGDAFHKNYTENHSLPYGFANTTPGNGHMNVVGHQIAANEIVKYLGGAAK